MAKKAAKKTTTVKKATSSTSSSTSSVEANYNKTLIEIQKLANNSAKSIQQMVNTSNEKQMQFNKSEAATARNWEKMMSDTSHQREVADLKKSGLNPVLSVNSGAQSYTTASASTNNDSGASATGAILEGQLGALSSLESSRMSATAQLKASAQAAAATRYAAKQSAAASNYRANIENEMNKRTTAAQLKIADIQKGNTVAGFVDKYLTKFGVTGAAENFIKKNVTPKLKAVLNKIKNDPYSMFQKSDKTINKNNFLLNKSGVNYFNNLTKTFGLKVNKQNRRMVVRAVVFHDRPAMNVVMRSYSDHWKHSSKSPQRRGHL